MRLALRRRLLRILREGHDDAVLSVLVTLIEQTAALSEADKTLRARVDSLHSAVFEHLPLPTKQMVLDRWVDRGTRGAMACWLKATRQHTDLFDAGIAVAYWRSSADERAARSLGYLASPELLNQLLPEMIRGCEQGWIIAKAVMRVGSVEEECWQAIRASHPATYLYLCAQTRRPIADDEAFDLVCRCNGFVVDGGRSLAIWAVGQMGRSAVLDRVRSMVDELQQRDAIERFGQPM